jgi:hypothetical protein
MITEVILQLYMMEKWIEFMPLVGMMLRTFILIASIMMSMRTNGSEFQISMLLEIQQLVAFSMGNTFMYFLAVSSSIQKKLQMFAKCMTLKNKNWEIISLNKKNRWVPCDLAMCYQISPTNILIFGGFDRQNRTNATFIFNTTKNTIERASDLPTVGSFSTMVFHIEDNLYTVGWAYIFLPERCHGAIHIFCQLMKFYIDTRTFIS